LDIEEYIEKIVENGKIDDMQTLSELLEDTMEIIKDYDKECYKEFEMKLYKMAYGSHLNKSMAEEIVNKMRPYGKRWSIEETRNLQEQRGIDDIDPIEFYVVINSAYNDYKDIFNEDIEGYIRFTIDFIKDEDAKPNKVFDYFVD
jgi:hypothetical protein